MSAGGTDERQHCNCEHPFGARTVFVAAALLFTTPGAAATEAPTVDRPSAIGTVDDTAQVRLTPAQIRRALPSARSFERGTKRSNAFGNVFCSATNPVGPAPVASAGAEYRKAPDWRATILVEEHVGPGAASQRFRAASRQIRQSCNGWVTGGFEYERKRSVPLRRMGQQTFAAAFRAREVSTDRIWGETIINAHRIGRFVVFVEALGGNTSDPTLDRGVFNRPLRQLERNVRGL